MPGYLLFPGDVACVLSALHCTVYRYCFRLVPIAPLLPPTPLPLHPPLASFGMPEEPPALAVVRPGQKAAFFDIPTAKKDLQRLTVEDLSHFVEIHRHCLVDEVAAMASRRLPPGYFLLLLS